MSYAVNMQSMMNWQVQSGQLLMTITVRSFIKYICIRLEFHLMKAPNFPCLVIFGILEEDDPVINHIEDETKWPPFGRGHFQMHFLEWKHLNFT